MHGLPHEAEFEYRAIILDEARVRRAAAGRKLRLLAGHILDRCGHQLYERARLGHERVRIRRFPLDVPADAPGRRLASALLDQHPERSVAVMVVEADIEARSRVARDEIDDRIADVDRGELEIRGIELGAAVIE